MRCVIFDIDGTIADMEWRRHHLTGERHARNWKAFNASMSEDQPKAPIVELLCALRLAGSHIVACSGREAVFREVTQKWFQTHDIHIDGLYMRGTKDYRDDAIIKSELLDQILKDGFEPWLVVDDRDRVVQMWRGRGLTCLQCAEGNF